MDQIQEQGVNDFFCKSHIHQSSPISLGKNYGSPFKFAAFKLNLKHSDSIDSPCSLKSMEQYKQKESLRRFSSLSIETNSDTSSSPEKRSTAYYQLQASDESPEIEKNICDFLHKNHIWMSHPQDMARKVIRKSSLVCDGKPPIPSFLVKRASSKFCQNYE